MTRRWLGTAVGLAVGFGAMTSATNAHAWKVITHVYLAQQAVKDLLDDGKLTFDEFVPPTGRQSAFKRTIGPYPADPKIYKAINENPAAYYSGIIAPDGMPDITTGQNIIHPPGGTHKLTNLGGPGSDFWLQHAWNRVWQPGSPYNTPLHQAYVLGLLGHGAGDTFAHTFVNAHTGGIFELGQNAARHIVFEGYLFQRTPDLERHGDPKTGKSLYDMVRDEGMNDALAKFHTDVLDPYKLREKAGAERQKSFLWQFGDLRAKVVAMRDYYQGEEARSKADYEKAKVALAAAKGAWTAAKAAHDKALAAVAPTKEELKAAAKDPAAGKATAKAKAAAVADAAKALGLAAAAVTAAEATLKLDEARVAAAPKIVKYVVPYFTPWIANIDKGIAAWPKTSHKVLRAIAFLDPNDSACKPGALDSVCQSKPENWKYDPKKACKAPLELVSEALNDFWFEHGTRMVGAPDTAAQVLEDINKVAKDFTDKVEQLKAELMAPFKSFAFNLKTNAAGFTVHAMKSAFGMDLCEFSAKWTKPSGYLDDVFGPKKANANSLRSAVQDTRDSKARATTTAELNEIMGLSEKTSAGNERWDWHKFAPAFNTVTLLKLSFLSKDQIDKLLTDLGQGELKLKVTPDPLFGTGTPPSFSPAPQGPPNVMLGWLGGMDGGHQFVVGDKIVFMRRPGGGSRNNCPLYYRLFMEHAGPTKGLKDENYGAFEPGLRCR